MNIEENDKLLKVLSCRYRETSATKTMKWSFEPVGTFLYVERTKDGWLFSKDKISEKVVPVRKGMAGKSSFTYINVRNIIDYDGDVAVYQQNEHTYLVKAAEQEQLRHKFYRRTMEEGDIRDVSGCYYIHLNKTRCNYMFGKYKFAKVHVVNDAVKAYMEVTPATEDEIRNIPTLKKITTPYGGWKTLDLVDEYTYLQPALSNDSKIVCPISFMRCNNKEKEPFLVWQNEEGAVIVEAHPIICDVCGKKISRYKDATIKGYTCGSCKKAIPKIKRLIDEDGFEATLKNIRGVQALLDDMLK